MTDTCTDTSFRTSRDRFEQVCWFLGDQEAASLTHGELEARLSVDVRELVRLLYQDHLDLRAAREQRRDDVVDAGGSQRSRVEAGQVRPLQSIFGPVEVTRLAYRRRGQANLYPADAALNLPRELASHGLRELSALESSRGSFEDASDAIARATGVRLGKRQLEQLAARAAADFETFYCHPSRSHATVTEGDLLVLSADGKGIVMRPDALRPATAKAAGQATAKLATRLSKGEKHNRKRMAEVGAVYDLTPVPLSSTGFDGGFQLPLSRVLGEGGASVLGLVLDRWDETDLPVEPAEVEPVDVLGDRDLEVVDVVPRSAVADQFGLEQ